MEFKKRAFKIKFSLFLAFLLVMLLCTLISRGIYAEALPRVLVEKPRNMSLIYQFESEGEITAGQVSAINIEEGLIVKEMMVKEGDRIKEGDVIVQLNLEFLKISIQDIELSIKALVIAIQDKEFEDSVYSKELKQLEVIKKQRQLDRYQDYLKQEGIITSDVAGIVMNSSIVAGEYTQESSVIRIAKTDNSLRFVTQITAGQRELLNIGDTVEICFEDLIFTDVVVISMEENQANDNNYDVEVEIPAQNLMLGKHGFLRFKKVSKSYPLCVPIECIYSEGMQNYVFVLKEGESILGEELRVEKRYVTIRKNNENYAALDESSGIADNKVIIYSNKRLEEGVQVRME